MVAFLLLILALMVLAMLTTPFGVAMTWWLAIMLFLYIAVQLTVMLVRAIYSLTCLIAVLIQLAWVFVTQSERKGPHHAA